MCRNTPISCVCLCHIILLSLPFDKMLTLDPNQRITCDKALHHRWFKQIHEDGNEASLSIKLPQEHDCHEMWSKEQKRKRRKRGADDKPIFEPLANQQAGSKTPEAFGSNAHRGHSAPFPVQNRLQQQHPHPHSQPINPSLDCSNHRNLDPTIYTYATICQRHQNLTVYDFLLKIGVKLDLKGFKLKNLKEITIEQILIGKHISELPRILNDMGVSLQ